MKVLIVDDEKTIRLILSAQIQEWGHEVLLANDGETAWQIFQAVTEPIILLVDWIMPGIDGIDLCNKIRRSENANLTHIIIMTGKRNEIEDLVIGFDAGADDFIIKPVNPRELKCRISVGQRILAYRYELEQRNVLLQETTKIIERVMKELNTTNEKLRAISMMDDLTGIGNRRNLESFLAKEWRYALRKIEPLTLIMIDVDFFKLYNDTYGHQAGDECLKKLADAFALVAKRSVDLTARYGGEEFAVVLRNTDSKGGQIVAESIRLAVESLTIPHSASMISPYVTVSLGIATITPTVDLNYTRLINQADSALYQAKAGGRNRWVAF